MYKFNLKLLLNSRVLPIWAVAALLAAIIVGYYGDIQSAGNSYSFFLTFGDSPPFPSGFFLGGLISFFILIAVIGIPNHLSKNLESDRAALLLSKSVTRTDFFLAEFAAVITITFFYAFITVIILAVLLLIEAGIFPFQLYLAILFYIPFYFTVIYISIVLLLILTRSYLASVLIGYLVIPFIATLLLRVDTFFKLIGWNSDFLLGLADVFSYFIPSTASAEQLMTDYEGAGANIEFTNGEISSLLSGVLYDGWASFDWQLFGFVIVSCIPFFLLSYYLMRRKEF